MDAFNNVDIQSAPDLSHFNKDSILHQMKRRGLKSGMFGDDTWIRLYPDIFDISNTTNSFFVEDTVQVDLNVTDHLNHVDEGVMDFLVYHYLGLDHIGHLQGPKRFAKFIFVQPPPKAR